MSIDPSIIHDNVVCLACGCLCDDIRVVVEGGRIVEAENACEIGRPWFLAEVDPPANPATIGGQSVALDLAIERAVEILQQAKAPLIWGLADSTIEDVSAALAIADRIGAVVDLTGSAAKLEVFQRMGHVSASLGEVKDRAEVVVFWGVDPLRTHPRHWERYSVIRPGRFIPEGRAGRFVIVVDSHPTLTSQSADLFVAVDPGRHAEVARALRCLIKGVELDPIRVAKATGLNFEDLQALADQLRRVHYGAFFFGPSLGEGADGRRSREALLALVRDLNEGRRFVALELGESGNPAGASAVMAWQTGASAAVDFGLGYPRHLPGEATLEARVKAGQVDAVLIVGQSPPVGVDLSSIPTILICPGSSDIPSCAVSFDVARPGIEAGGTVSRVDGVMFRLEPLVATRLPSAREVLDLIHQRLLNSEPARPEA